MSQTHQCAKCGCHVTGPCGGVYCGLQLPVPSVSVVSPGSGWSSPVMSGAMKAPHHITLHPGSHHALDIAQLTQHHEGKVEIYVPYPVHGIPHDVSAMRAELEELKARILALEARPQTVVNYEAQF